MNDLNVELGEVSSAVEVHGHVACRYEDTYVSS
jgi:hypothetical protein